MWSPDERLIVALDFPDAKSAMKLVNLLADDCKFYKVGLELIIANGFEIIDDLKAMGKRVFLDMKLLDISNTMKGAVRSAARRNVDFLTIHGVDSSSIRAAVDALPSDSKLNIMAVTVLTSLTPDDLLEQGTELTAPELVIRRAQLAISNGAHGVIASGQEAKKIAEIAPDNFLIVTPGIRMPDNDKGDQQRVVTPESAISAGATHLVVGRPITQADDPSKSAKSFNAAIFDAISGEGKNSVT